MQTCVYMCSSFSMLCAHVNDAMICIYVYMRVYMFACERVFSCVRVFYDKMCK